ncbi:MAG TPA: hypothetical protein VHF22_06925 [Planctomycetota bacterium]|nr:hypothetical protein [Planctomycetota bacterium]
MTVPADAGAAAVPAAPGAGSRSPWKRRLVVLGLDLLAAGLVAGWFFGARPEAELQETNLGNAIEAFKRDSSEGQRTAIETAYKAYRRQEGVGTGLLVAALVVLVGAGATRRVWILVESRRAAAAAKA